MVFNPHPCDNTAVPDRQFKMIRYYGAYCRKWKSGYKRYLSQSSIRQCKIDEFGNKSWPRCPKCGSRREFVEFFKKDPPIIPEKREFGKDTPFQKLFNPRKSMYPWCYQTTSLDCSLLNFSHDLTPCNGATPEESSIREIHTCSLNNGGRKTSSYSTVGQSHHTALRKNKLFLLLFMTFFFCEHP